MKDCTSIDDLLLQMLPQKRGRTLVGDADEVSGGARRPPITAVPAFTGYAIDKEHEKRADARPLSTLTQSEERPLLEIAILQLTGLISRLFFFRFNKCRSAGNLHATNLPP